MSTSSPTTTAEELIAESINIGTSNRIEKNRQELREGAPATVTTKSNNNYNLVKKRKATTTTTSAASTVAVVLHDYEAQQHPQAQARSVQQQQQQRKQHQQQNQQQQPINGNNNNNGGGNSSNNNKQKKVQQLRRGNWTPEEEAYANRVIQEFEAGLLPLTNGTTLRTYLSKLLNCDPMRISKKFVGSCLGNQVFRKRTADLNRLTPEPDAYSGGDINDGSGGTSTPPSSSSSTGPTFGSGGTSTPSAPSAGTTFDGASSSSSSSPPTFGSTGGIATPHYHDVLSGRGIGIQTVLEKNRQALREGAPATVTTKSNNNNNNNKNHDPSPPQPMTPQSQQQQQHPPSSTTTPQDVLSGRGGGITPQDVLSGIGKGSNSHPGNKVFREWVRLRKEDYNLARDTEEKTVVAREVVRQVQQQNGRFLTKDTSVVGGSGVHWWVEIDEIKVLTKTKKALREVTLLTTTPPSQDTILMESTERSAASRKLVKQFTTTAEEHNNNSSMTPQSQQDSLIDAKMINESWKVLMESTERSAASRKLVKQFKSTVDNTHRNIKSLSSHHFGCDKIAKKAGLCSTHGPTLPNHLCDRGEPHHGNTSTKQQQQELEPPIDTTTTTATTTATTTLGIDNDNNDKENDIYKTVLTLPSGNNEMSSLSSKTSFHPPSYPPQQRASSFSNAVTFNSNNKKRSSDDITTTNGRCFNVLACGIRYKKRAEEQKMIDYMAQKLKESKKSYEISLIEKTPTQRLETGYRQLTPKQTTELLVVLRKISNVKNAFLGHSFVTKDTTSRALKYLLSAIRHGLMHYPDTCHPKVVQWNGVSKFCINSHIPLLIALFMALRNDDDNHKFNSEEWNKIHTEVMYGCQYAIDRKKKGKIGCNSNPLTGSTIEKTGEVDKDGKLVWKRIDARPKFHNNANIRNTSHQFTGGGTGSAYITRTVDGVSIVWPEFNDIITVQAITDLGKSLMNHLSITDHSVVGKLLEMRHWHSMNYFGHRPVGIYWFHKDGGTLSSMTNDEMESVASKGAQWIKKSAQYK